MSSTHNPGSASNDSPGNHAQGSRAVVHSPTTFDEALDTLRDLDAQMQARHERLVDAEESVELSPIVVVLDELLEKMPHRDRAVTHEAREIIGRIARIGRSANVHLVLLSSAEPSCDQLSAEVRDNLKHAPAIHLPG